MSHPQIGIIAGSFSPPHLGHLMLGIYSLHQYKLDEIWYMPAYSHPEKSSHQYSYDQRCNLVELMVKKYPFFKVCKIESELKTNKTYKTYTYLVFAELLKKYPDNNFHLIIGDDLQDSIKKWYQYKKLSDLIKIHVIPREFCVSAISSTQIRKMIVEDDKWEKLKLFLDPYVLEEIKKIPL